MPVTPFHFGPGLLAKSVAPRKFSLSAFAVAEIVVDVETVVNLMQRRWPVHGHLHSLLGSLSVGLAAGLGTFLVGRAIIRWLGTRKANPVLQSEISLRGCLLGGLTGGITASLLDAVMHDDVAPFWPLTSENPLHHLVGVGALHWGCVIAGVIGVFLLWRRGLVGAAA